MLLKTLKQQLSQLVTEGWQLFHQIVGNFKCKECRDRRVSSLKLGKHAPGYKAAAKALDLLIREVKCE